MKPGTGFILCTCALALPAQASWAGQVTGKVKYVAARNSDGVISVEIDGTTAGAPACATHSYFLIKDENSHMGAVQLSMLLTAKASGQVVRVTGSDACTRWPDGEDINVVEVLP